MVFTGTNSPHHISGATAAKVRMRQTRLVDAILNNCGHLRISSQFYFYLLARHVLQQGGIGDRD
jgi:hypothetical protein